MIKKILIFTCAIFISSNVCAKRLHNERYYQEKNCDGIVEYRLPDRTRVDCLTEEYAIETDFAGKFYQAIGQSLHYARLTGKKAGIQLIVEKESDMKYYYRLLDNINHYKLPITVWLVNKENIIITPDV